MDGSHAAKEPEKVVFPPSLQCSREVRRWLSHAISHLILQRERKKDKLGGTTGASGALVP